MEGEMKRRHFLGSSVGAIGALAPWTGGLGFTPPSGGAPVSILAHGADPSGVADSTSAIQAAIRTAVASGSAVYAPAGLYKIIPNIPLEALDGTVMVAFTMQSNLHVVADPGATFRIADEISTSTRAVRMAMFFTNTVVTNLTFIGLTIDMNGLHNRITSSAPSSYSRFNQAHIFVSGNLNGVAAAASHVRIESCQFLNTAGTSCIVMAQSNTPGVALGRDWAIVNCRFQNNGLDTDDHSSIYGWADDVLVADNTFIADTMWGAVGKAGARVAHEVHGARHRFVNNQVSNYLQGLWVGGNYTTEVVDTVISNNVFSPIRGAGIAFFRAKPFETSSHNTLIAANVFRFDDSPVDSGLKVGIDCATQYAVGDIRVVDNIMEKDGVSVAASFSRVRPSTQRDQVPNRIVIRGNQQHGGTLGIALYTNGANGLGSIVIHGNDFFDLTGAGGYSRAVGIALASKEGTVASLTIGANTFSATTTTRWDYGVYLAGTIEKLAMRGNTYFGVVEETHFDPELIVKKRRGDFSGILYSPVWAAGAPIALGTGHANGEYDLYGPRVSVRAKLVVGKTTTIPGGPLTFTVPTDSARPGASYLGAWRIRDSSAGRSFAGIAEFDGTNRLCRLIAEGGGK